MLGAVVRCCFYFALELKRTGWIVSRAPRALHARWLHGMSRATSHLHHLVEAHHMLMRASSTVPSTEPLDTPLINRTAIPAKLWDARLGRCEMVTSDAFPDLTDLDLAMQLTFTDPSDAARLADMEREAARRQALPPDQRPPSLRRTDLPVTSALREALVQATRHKAIRSMPSTLSMLHSLTICCTGDSTVANTVAIMRSWASGLPRPPSKVADALWLTFLGYLPNSSAFNPHKTAVPTGSQVCRAIWALGLFCKDDPKVTRPRRGDLEACGTVITNDLDTVSTIDTFNLLCGLVLVKCLPATAPLLPLLTRLAWVAESMQPPAIVAIIYQLSVAVSSKLVHNVEELISSNSLLQLGGPLNSHLRSGEMPPRDVVNLLIAMSRLRKSPSGLGLSTQAVVMAIGASLDQWKAIDVMQAIHALSRLPVALPVQRNMLLPTIIRCAPHMRDRDIAQTLLRLSKAVEWPPPRFADIENNVPLKYGFFLGGALLSGHHVPPVGEKAFCGHYVHQVERVLDSFL